MKLSQLSQLLRLYGFTEEQFFSRKIEELFDPDAINERSREEQLVANLAELPTAARAALLERFELMLDSALTVCGPVSPSIRLVEHRLGWLVIRISTIPARGGRTEIATRPRPFVVAALFSPGPLTRIRTPLTPRFLSITTTLTTPRRPTESDRGCTIRFGQLATGGAIGPRTRVGALARLFAVFASDWSPTTVAVLSSAPGSVGRTTIVVQTDVTEDRGKLVSRSTQTQAVIVA